MHQVAQVSVKRFHKEIALPDRAGINAFFVVIFLVFFHTVQVKFRHIQPELQIEDTFFYQILANSKNFFPVQGTALVDIALQFFQRYTKMDAQ